MPGGGIKNGEQQWQACKKGFFLPVRVLSRLFIEGLHEFIRRFMLHVLPSGFHRIRHFGLLASRPKMALARQLLDTPAPEVQIVPEKENDAPAVFNCRKCQQPLEIMAIKEPTYLPRAPPKAEVR